MVEQPMTYDSQDLETFQNMKHREEIFVVHVRGFRKYK